MGEQSFNQVGEIKSFLSLLQLVSGLIVIWLR